MLKTYLYIPEHLEEKIILTAKTQNKSKAEIIRQALEKGIKIVQHQGNASIDVLFKLEKLGKKYKIKGPKDAVEHFDNYLYGKDWSKDE